ncbi:pericentriolar material 1 protein-like isoform X2 [Mercenaria mercenaria]|uniref:pericentriolar material 1 protein-like isoform X2 n=1 Tax=Mercenaria mercenaria TaxID=6596 RepID=UPI00234E7659|nr:pericentriolar material 1 protein-like isoform X2 [Mercenaria mercenaria]
MASGGQNQRNPKTSASEPRQRTSWQRTTSMSDKDDNVSLNSFPNDLRPNNWDISDWRPAGNKDQTKRRKKGNPEWEREQSLTQDSPPPSERQHGTPRTFPRTKITPSTPTSQRVALENLRQAMTFSDQEDGVSNDGERNNERNLLRRRENLPNYGRQESGGNVETQLSRPVPNQREDRNNRNNNKQNQNEARAATVGKPDSSQIVGRLMQIRDYIKQASSMMDSLRKSGDPLNMRKCCELNQLVLNMKDIESECLQNLTALWSVRDEPDVNDASREMTPNAETLDDTRSVDLDIQSELSDREERPVSSSSRPRIEDNLGLTSDNDGEVEEGVPSETSENSSTMDDTVISARKNEEWDYELGESELALGGVNNPREAAETLVALRQQQELLQKLIEQQEQMRALRGRQAALLALQQDAEAKLATTRQKSNEARSVSNTLEEAAAFMTNRVDSLSAAGGASGSNATRQQQADPELLDIRQQLQYLRNELKSQDQNTQAQAATGRNLQSNRPRDARPKNQPPPRPPSPKFADRPTSEREAQLVRDMVPPTEMSKDQLQARLQELLGKKDQLDKLIQEEFSNPMLPMPTEQMNRDELQNKLRELQGKKKRMDSMLQELQSLRSNPAFLLNNALSEAGNRTAPTPPSAEMDPVNTSTEGTDNLTNGVLEMLDSRQKMQKLNEVKDRLSQLKSLVHMYESTEGASGSREQVDNEDQASVPAYSDYGVEAEVSRDRGPDREPQQVKATVKPQINIPVRPQQQALEDSDENNSSSSSSSSSSSESETESQLSSLGPWGDDPEIQEKVKKLKAAKEKLKHLQNLVAIVQHSPGMAEELPDNLAEIAASMEDVESQLTQTDDRNNASEGEVPNQTERDAYYQVKMEEQMNELEDLQNEKSRLLAIQTQLQSLHDKFTQAEAGRQPQEGQDSRDGARPKSPMQAEPGVQQQDNSQQQSGGPSVTFSSNDEVYYKMRNQRMLREELRDKKKQLESIMKKDRNKKQYYKNQDNQSDTVSYSTEMFGMGASVDQTMATWGGSTVDNLESITEDGAAQDNDEDEEDDDAYPIDGILQVEEEEEENQSDNETYTIEDDVRQRRKARAMAKSSNPEGNTRKGKSSFPRPGRQGDTRPKEAWTRPADFKKWSRKGRKSRQQENYRSAEEIVQEDEEPDTSKSAVEELQRKLEETSMLCQSLLGENQPTALLGRQTAAGFGSHGQLDFQQQLQQQQLMMSLNQCYQQISMQQMEMQNMQRQMQALVYQIADGDVNESGFSSDLRVRSLSSLYSPMLPRQSPSVFLPPGDAFQFNPIYQHTSPASNRLLRRAADPESGNRSDVAEGPERQRRSSRQSARDSYSQRSKKKSLSPPQLNNVPTRRSKTTSVQTYPEAEEEEEEAMVFCPERETFEDYLSRKRREFLERNNLQNRSQRQSQDTGARKSSKSKSGGSDREVYRPGLSAGISGAGYAEDGRSITSSIQSSVAAVSQANQADTRESARETEDPMEMSLFETLRETIYSEVATLISQNENRPHYLIELFRELQLLTTDYLRQRVLYDIKDVVSKYLVEENSVSAPPPPWLNTATGNFTNAELTPSESNVTTDDEEIKYLLQTKLKQKVASNLVAKERQKTAQLIRTGSLKNDKYDYQEQAEVTSSVSTPSNSFWDNPFASDSLGETVINLDKTLEKMKEYEKRLAAKNEKVKTAETRGTEISEVSSSAMDQGDESSVNSDSVPYPRIDTQQLDQQIKSIMTEVIPVIKEHMDNMCSPQLLAYIKRLVLSLTRQYDSGEEFARFFHRQLGSILQDTLAKYEGRKMRECGEDLLVDMSEVLFNELAFFRLMQDLDDPLIAEKMKKAEAISDSEEETERDIEKEERDEAEGSDDETDTTETTANASDNQDDTRPTQTEEEDLGKARDDELANEVEVQDAVDKDEDPESPFKGVQIELAPSETKPYTRIGSDEDDESADDESQSNEDDPSETAVSINARRITDSVYTDDNEDDATRHDGSIEAGATNEGLVPVSLPGQDQGKDADQGASSGKVEAQSTELMNGDLSPTQAAENMNGDILNGDIEVITMDDLPASLTVMSSEDLQQKLNQEQQNNFGAAAVLGTMETTQELVGDPQFLKEPDEASG